MRPTKAHFLQKQAELASADNAIDLASFSDYEKMLHLLARHKKDLKLIQSMERKAAFKATILPHYLPWIEGVLKTGAGKQDNVLMTWLVWAIDCQQYALALQIADYALHQDLVLPEQFNRTVPTLLVEEFADKAKQAQKSQQPFEVGYLQQVDQLTQDYDMPDESRARLFRELGLLLKDAEPATALAYLERAVALNINIGVQGEVKKLRKQLSLEDQ